VTRTEGLSVRVIRMLPQLVGLFSVERACVKIDVFFQVLMKFAMQSCLGILEIQILMILRRRFQLVAARNDRTGKKFYPVEMFQKVNT
jgi:hypothetical protein